ncbi:MAG: hypothetical protein WDA59_05715 [Methanofastidiosum sp.]|jgi:hypothetical protein|nr:hypothetical protein [Tenuifilaceae bacterium]
MEKIKIKVTKYRVSLNRINEDLWEEGNQGWEGQYDMDTNLYTSDTDARQRAIMEAAQKVAGMNQHALSSAKENNEPFYYKLIISGV